MLNIIVCVSYSACVVYSETLLTSLLENLHFDFEIEPLMCKLWVDKVASTELTAWIEKSLIHSFVPLFPRNSTREKFAYAFRNQSKDWLACGPHAQEMLKLCIDYDRALSQSFIDTWIKQERENNDYL